MLVFKKITTILFLFVCTGITLFAQQETTLPALTWVPQAGYTDVTIMPDQYKTSVSLPLIGSFQLYYFNSAFTYNNLVKNNTIDPNLVIPKLKTMNHLYSGGSYDIFSMRFKTEKTYYQVSIRDVWTQRFDYTKDLMNLVWNGNAPYAGKTADLNGVRVGANYYRELALAATKPVNDKLTVGVRGKFLMGMVNVTTKESQSNLYTAPDGMSVSGQSEFTLLTSGVAGSESFNASNFFGLKNLGLAADLGARYKLSEKLSIACNVNNIGFIHWKGQVKNYRVNGDYTSTGYLMRDSADVMDADWQNVLDTLEAVFKPKEDSKAYTSWLSPTIYISGNYSIKENTIVYASFATDIYHAIRPAFTVGAVQQIGKTLQATVNYSIMADNYFNIGGGFVVRGGPAQFYLTCDNLVGLFDPYSVKYFNARLGLNFLFGKVDTSN
jgi:hypothetical protein